MIFSSVLHNNFCWLSFVLVGQCVETSFTLVNAIPWWIIQKHKSSLAKLNHQTAKCQMFGIQKYWKSVMKLIMVEVLSNFRIEFLAWWIYHRFSRQFKLKWMKFEKLVQKTNEISFRKVFFVLEKLNQLSE